MAAFESSWLVLLVLWVVLLVVLGGLGSFRVLVTTYDFHWC